MNIKILNNRLGNLARQNNLMLVLVFSLLGLNFLQAFVTLFKDEKTIIIPPNLHQEAWIEGDRVSASYLEEMAVFFADLILENTPNGAAYRRNIVLRHASSKGFGALKTQLLEDEKRLKKEHLSTSFQANTVKVDSQNMAVEIGGDLMRYVGKKLISQSRDVYRFEFEYRHARLLIKSFKLVRSDKNES